ncbi:SRPBCC family protein [Aquimarina algiphila]|uniref:SRPBCC family protein n=1 Tax=Aquimarina algiphila TaxID=2047982 RepID=UPI0024913909|nr:SRPBCC domain-containing protein [Aquimarina algiphila]
MDFKKTIRVKASKEKAFEAITTEVNKWWGNVDNKVANEIGHEFSVFFEEDTEWRFVISELEEFRHVTWRCIYANHSFSGLKNIKKEWLNSEISFVFKGLSDEMVEVSFTHKGLTPNLNCYEICDAGWTHFVASSLKQYLETGIGAPNLVANSQN